MVITLKEIFSNDWDNFVRQSGSKEIYRPAVEKNVWKLINCRTLVMGIQTYACDKCAHVMFVANTCKSRFCPSCGYKANLNWLNSLLDRLIPCTYQHLVFSLPSELRPLFKCNRRIVATSMYRAIARSIQQYNKRHNLVGGEFGVLHTFGSDRKLHPHFHILRTRGGINSKTDAWEDSSYVPEKYLKAAWKSKFLNLLRRAYAAEKLWFWGKRQEFHALLADLYRKNWHVYVRSEPVDDCISVGYIGRYVKRAPFSQRSIAAYKKGEYVKLRWKAKEKLADWLAYTVPIFDFIESLIIHIPNHYDHLVYYSGLFAPTQKKRLYAKAMAHFRKTVKRTKPFTWQKLKKLNWGDDPLKCPKCGGKMIFVRMIHFRQAETVLYEIKNYQLVVRGLDSS
jgi:hypothetical protein